MDTEILREQCFSVIVNELFRPTEKISVDQFLQLRFIAAVMRKATGKAMALPKNKSLDEIIAGWEQKNIIGLQESLMKKRDETKIKKICETEMVDLGELLNCNDLIKLNTDLSDYENKDFEKCKLQKSYFKKVVDRFCNYNGKYDIRQFYRLRYITAVIIKTGLSKIDKIPKSKTPKQVISDWEGSKIIGLQEEAMRERDLRNLNVISKLCKIDLTESLDLDRVFELHYLLGESKKEQGSLISKDCDFSKIAYHFCNTPGRGKLEPRYNLEQFYQLRFITSIIKEGRWRMDELPEGKSIDSVIEEWLQTGVVDIGEKENQKSADERKLGEILITCLGSEICARFRKKGVYKLKIGMMIKFNELLNSYSEKWNRKMSQGKTEEVSDRVIISVYQILDEWADDDECPLTEADVIGCFEKKYYASLSVVNKEWKKLILEIKENIELGKEYVQVGGNIIANKIIVEELKHCRKRINQRCGEIGEKKGKIYFGFEDDTVENPNE